MPGSPLRKEHPLHGIDTDAFVDEQLDEARIAAESTPPVQVPAHTEAPQGIHVIRGEKEGRVEQVPGRSFRQFIREQGFPLSPHEEDQAVWAMHQELARNERLQEREERFRALFQGALEAEITRHVTAAGSSEPDEALKRDLELIADIIYARMGIINDPRLAEKVLPQKVEQRVQRLQKSVDIHPTDLGMSHSFLDDDEPLSDMEMRRDIQAALQHIDDVLFLIDREVEYAMMTSAPQESSQEQPAAMRWLQVDGAYMDRTISDASNLICPDDYIVAFAELPKAADSEERSFWVAQSKEKPSLPPGVIGEVAYFRPITGKTVPNTVREDYPDQRERHLEPLVEEAITQSRDDLHKIVVDLEQQDTRMFGGRVRSLLEQYQSGDTSVKEALLNEIAREINIFGNPDLYKPIGELVRRLIEPNLDMYTADELIEDIQRHQTHEPQAMPPQRPSRISQRVRQVVLSKPPKTVGQNRLRQGLQETQDMELPTAVTADMPAFMAEIRGMVDEAARRGREERQGA